LGRSSCGLGAAFGFWVWTASTDDGRARMRGVGDGLHITRVVQELAGLHTESPSSPTLGDPTSSTVGPDHPPEPDAIDKNRSFSLKRDKGGGAAHRQRRSGARTVGLT
jgi:hypothetical protein